MRLIEVASDYIEVQFLQQFASWGDFIESQRAFYRANASHVCDCFTDTADWVEGEDFSVEELNAEIVHQVMTGAWTGKR